MNEQETITEIEYILERGVPNNVQIILYALLGAIKSDDTATLATVVQQYSITRIGQIRSGL